MIQTEWWVLPFYIEDYNPIIFHVTSSGQEIKWNFIVLSWDCAIILIHALCLFFWVAHCHCLLCRTAALLNIIKSGGTFKGIFGGPRCNILMHVNANYLWWCVCVVPLRSLVTNFVQTCMGHDLRWVNWHIQHHKWQITDKNMYTFSREILKDGRQWQWQWQWFIFSAPQKWVWLGSHVSMFF